MRERQAFNNKKYEKKKMQNLRRSLVWVSFFVLNGFMPSPSSACSTDSDCPPCQTCTFQVWSNNQYIPQSDCQSWYNELNPYGYFGNVSYDCGAGNRCVNGPNYAQCEQKIAQANLNAAQLAYNNAFTAMGNDETNNSNGLCTAQWQASTAPGSPCETLLSALNQYSNLSHQTPSAIICASIGSEDPNCATNTPSDSTFCDGFCGNAPPPPAASSETMFAAEAPEKMMVRRFAVFHRIMRGWVKPEDRVYSPGVYVHRDEPRRDNSFHDRRENQSHDRRENKPQCSSKQSHSPACVIYRRDHR